MPKDIDQVIAELPDMERARINARAQELIAEELTRLNAGKSRTPSTQIANDEFDGGEGR
jgi:hypothetical protein